MSAKMALSLVLCGNKDLLSNVRSALDELDIYMVSHSNSLFAVDLANLYKELDFQFFFVDEMFLSTVDFAKFSGKIGKPGILKILVTSGAPDRANGRRPETTKYDFDYVASVPIDIDALAAFISQSLTKLRRLSDEP